MTDIFRCAFLKDWEQMIKSLHCRSCLCSCTHLQGISLNLSRAKHAPHLSTNLGPSALQIHLHMASILPKLFTILTMCPSKTPAWEESRVTSASRKSRIREHVGCLLSSPAWKLSPAKGFRARKQEVIYKTTPKIFHYTWTFFFLG